MANINERIEFIHRAVDALGGMAIQEDTGLAVLLPTEITSHLRVPEEFTIAYDSERFQYGNPFLDNVIRLVTRDIIITSAILKIPYLKKQGFDRIIEEEFLFKHGKLEFLPRKESTRIYTEFLIHYIALSDERKEGLIREVLQEESGVRCPNFKENRRQFEYVRPDSAESLNSLSLRMSSLLPKVEREVIPQIEAEMSEFIASMNRRLNRDVINTQDYYAALEIEMSQKMHSLGESDEQKRERQQKIDELANEAARKISDLASKYKIDLSIEIVGAMRFEVPVVAIPLRISYRQTHKEFNLIWNPVSRAFDALRCEYCGQMTKKCTFQVRKNDLLLQCLRCESASTRPKENQ